MANTYDDNQDSFNRRRRPRPVTDYGSSLVQWVDNRRPRYKGTQQYEQERPNASYVVDMLPPAARLDSPAESVPVRHLHTSLGKSKKPITVVRWMPEGRRLLAGVHNGEFMLWNGMSFNFETVTAMGSSSLRAAEWSNRKDWLVAANDEGIVYYLQPTLNNPHQFRGHDAPIRDLAFSPTDTKFVTASDDNTLKIWDFTSSTNESTFKDHGWDVKSCDWHPTKGLVASGSKDHSVRLWDPRTTRSLTTLHGHKNAITVTMFSRLRDQLLATAGRDQQARIFDLRMMRDVCVLRGHEKGITSLAWHPVHSSLLSTGGEDGSLFSYLLDEPNTPIGVAASTTSPYNTSDPRSAPPQSVYPAHRINHAHESSIWSLDWHPIGHILATGSNDHFTRFWSRSLPGQTNCFKDQFHLGEEGAEAQGTWDRKFGRRQAREQEEQEAEDEAEGLEDQGSAIKPAFSIPGLPLSSSSNNPSSAPPPLIPGMGSLPVLPPPPSQFSSTIPGIVPGLSNHIISNNISGPPPQMDPTLLATLLQSTQQQSNLRTGTPPTFLPPPPPGSSGMPIDFSRLPLQLPPGFPPPPGFAPPPPSLSLPPGTAGAAGGGSTGIPGLRGGDRTDSPVNGGSGGDGGASRRLRAPLPSQQESLKAEQAKGNFRIAR